MNPVISIIIPVYNTEKYLPKCLDSAINQTYKNIEIVVIDDCSSGNCAEIVNSYQQKDDRVVYIKNPTNVGTYKTREIAISKAHGMYILCLDSDDWLELNICEKLQEQLDRAPDLLEYAYRYVDESVVEPCLPKSDLTQYSKQELFTRFLTLQSEPWFMVRYLLKRDISLKVCQELQVHEHLTIHEDLLFLIVYSYYINNAASIDVVGYNYNWNNMNSAMRERRTITVLQKELNAASIVVSYLERFFDSHKLDKELLFDVKRNLCKSFLGTLQFYERDQETMNAILKQSIDLFGSNIFGLFIVANPELLPNWIRTLLKIQDKFFPKDGAFFKILKKIYYKIKRLKKQ